MPASWKPTTLMKPADPTARPPWSLVMSSRRRLGFVFALLLALPAASTAGPPIENRPSYAFEADPYYPHKDFPKLTTPQWVGEEGVEGVVVLAVDDMSKPAIYETFLRPILDRLKAIDGRAPVSIMTNQVDPADPRLQGWLKEGLSIEIHTIGHPCPFFHGGDFDASSRAYHDCVDLISKIPNNRPVAFRMPCCDSINSPGPRFFAELFNKTSPRGNFLTIDTSVFNIPTPDDPSLPRSLVVDPDGREKFRKYLPFKSFVNTIENYPYPYVIGGRCWEFPCAVPSDWEGQNIHKPNNPKTLEDMKAALDIAVLKKGVYNLVFHPHNWIQNSQVVELIDHAVKTHGKKVKFLNFREAQERLDKNLLTGNPIRGPKGNDNGVELVDLNNDGFLDVVRSHDAKVEGRVWKPESRTWETLADAAEALRAARPAVENGPALPPHASRLDDQGRDAGLRFVDVDEDGHLDVVFSNDAHYGLYLFDPATKGWTREVIAGNAGEPGALPKIVKNGANNGFFVHSRSLWWQNEDTDKLPDIVDRRSFNDLLKDVAPQGKTPAAALRSFRVAPGFRVELAASEPQVEDPIAIEWSADGRLWVLEMGDYPLGVGGRAGGVVRILDDADGDGRYERSTTFLDGLAYPSAIMPWRNGVLIGCAPDLFYAEDRDGDGRADHREVLFTGFGEGNQQHRFNGFELGLDGWVYGANGDSNGVVRSLKTGQTVNIQGRDFRFQPDTGAFETESGQTQYGRRRDDWGDWFGNNNPNWAWRFLLAESDLRRNPHFAAPDPREMLEADTLLHPLSRTLARFNEPGSVNHVTSANSPTPYRDDLFGDHFRTSLFVSEPVHNLVHRMVVEPDGSASKGVRAPGEADREFLASSDNWFRPTQMKTGPDGALWIADMYRAVIEHPQWIPPEIQRTIDLRAGSKEGRIYRVVPVDRKPRPIDRLDRLDVSGLVAALESPNGWRRDTAQRLLLHKQDPAAVETLRKLIAASRSEKTRVQAVWTLSLLEGLD
ncbi:MAG: dehydrogenase, partial [Paludisphaera borealis]|uniref:PVC-type heme-binding CxxCH protein n=1 Tax=Paludisphaera borealis TaxID=1387353 RepID=UPI00284DC053|nr:dehydrogenase [Paludisphaera borealis]